MKLRAQKWSNDVRYDSWRDSNDIDSYYFKHGKKQPALITVLV